MADQNIKTSNVLFKALMYDSLIKRIKSAPQHVQDAANAEIGQLDQPQESHVGDPVFVAPDSPELDATPNATMIDDPLNLDKNEAVTEEDLQQLGIAPQTKLSAFGGVVNPVLLGASGVLSYQDKDRPRKKSKPRNVIKPKKTVIRPGKSGPEQLRELIDRNLSKESDFKSMGAAPTGQNVTRPKTVGTQYGQNALSSLPIKMAEIREISPFCAAFLERAIESNASPMQLRAAIKKACALDPAIADEWKNLFEKASFVKRASGAAAAIGSSLVPALASTGVFLGAQPAYDWFTGADVARANEQTRQALIDRNLENAQSVVANYQVTGDTSGFSGLPLYQTLRQLVAQNPTYANNPAAADQVAIALTERATFDPTLRNYFENPNVNNALLRSFARVNTAPPGTSGATQAGAIGPAHMPPGVPGSTQADPPSTTTPPGFTGPQRTPERTPTTSTGPSLGNFGNIGLGNQAATLGGLALGAYGLGSTLMPGTDEQGKRKNINPINPLLGLGGLGLAAYGATGGNPGAIFNQNFWKTSSFKKKADFPALGDLFEGVGNAFNRFTGSGGGGAANNQPDASSPFTNRVSSLLPQAMQGFNNVTRNIAQAGSAGANALTTSGRQLANVPTPSNLLNNAAAIPNATASNVVPTAVSDVGYSGARAVGQHTNDVIGLGALAAGNHNIPMQMPGFRSRAIDMARQGIQGASQPDMLSRLSNTWNNLSPWQTAALMGGLGLGAYGLTSMARRRRDDEEGSASDWLLPALGLGGGLALGAYGLTGGNLANTFSPSRWVGQPGHLIGQPINHTNAQGENVLDAQGNPINLASAPQHSSDPAEQEAFANNYYNASARVLADRVDLASAFGGGDMQSQQQAIQALAALNNMPDSAQQNFFAQQVATRGMPGLAIVGALGGEGNEGTVQQLQQLGGQLGFTPEQIQRFANNARAAYQQASGEGFDPEALNEALNNGPRPPMNSSPNAVASTLGNMLGGGPYSMLGAAGTHQMNAPTPTNPNAGAGNNSGSPAPQAAAPQQDQAAVARDRVNQAADVGYTVAGTSALHRLGGMGLGAAGLLANAGVDLVDLVGLHPGRGNWLQPANWERLTRNAEELAQGNPFMRALNAAARPLTMPLVGGVAAANAAGQVGDAVDATNRTVRMETRPSSPPPLTGVNSIDAYNSAMRLLASRVSGNLDPIAALVVNPEIAADATTVALDAYDRALRRQQATDWYNQRPLTPPSSVNAQPGNYDRYMRALAEREAARPRAGDSLILGVGNTLNNMSNNSIADPREIFTGQFQWPWQRQ